MAESKSLRDSEFRLYIKLKPEQWPIVYHPTYNIGFLGLEKLHPFDSGKWGKIYRFLRSEGMLKSDNDVIQPLEASGEELRKAHTERYLDSLQWSVNVAKVTEVPLVALIPNFLVQRRVLRPLRLQTGGSILAAKLALERGWAINIGGGFHHCCSDQGGGFCAYADITLAVNFLFERCERVQKAMIIDLDAHQGNGHERDFMNNDRVYILDVYNAGIYPGDSFAKKGITRKIELRHGTKDDEYLRLVNHHVDAALNEFKPDVIVFNAGTDVLEGDPLGNLSITADGIVQRDEIVFKFAHDHGIPIFMVTSGGYQQRTARVIADSILNLSQKGFIPGPQPDKPDEMG
jgi:histone deacetylase 11